MRISEALGVSSARLWKQGVFDSYLGIDSRLHLDPALLRQTKVPELRNSLSRFEKYFTQTMLLVTRAKPGGALARQAIARLVFPEIPQAALGYATASSAGRGVNLQLASQLYETAKELADVGIDDPAIFEIAVVFEQGFGADLISDMTLSVIAADIGAFNKRVCAKLGIPTRTLALRNEVISAAYSKKTGQSILLLPLTLLSVLPEATSFYDIGEVVEYNERVRKRLNELLGANWARQFARLHKSDRKRLLLRNPEIVRAMLAAYRARKPQPYDFDKDPLGEVVWAELGQEFAEEHRLSLEKPSNAVQLAAVVTSIAKQFKRLIEENGACKLLYNDDGKQRPEKFAQLLFYSIADSYCKANNLDISAEPNAGRGPVDFKLSRGYSNRATVELKLSSNSAALNGLLAQLPAYAKAEQAVHSCFVLLVTGRSRAKVDEIVDVRNKLLGKRKAVPDLVLIDAYDAYNAPSASNLEFNVDNWR